MKKIIYFLLIIILVAGIAGGAYAGYKYFKKDKDPATDTNILTESKELLNNHASITFGEGDSAWTISTADKLEPIYIDDLRAPGKGVDIGHSNNGGSSAGIPLESFVKIDGANVISLSINAQKIGTNGNIESGFLNYSISKKNGEFVWDWCKKSIYENLLHVSYTDITEEDIATLEQTINSTAKAGDNYWLGSYTIMFELKNVEKYGENSSLYGDFSKSPNSNVVLFFEIPVYYRVK